MFTLSSLLHLRIPFSYFLLPIFLFALAISPNVIEKPLLWTFIIVHFLLYPASNGYNSYFDKDEKSIGGLKNPPPVKKGLYYLALSFDVIAIVLGYIKVNATFAIMLLLYGLVSKAYSHPSMRLKKYAITGWIVTGLFQGLFTVVMCYVGINDFGLETALNPKVILAGCVATVMLWANYPMTQIYQHDEDRKHGDNTISMRLGIRGTFYFVGLMFFVATIGFVAFFQSYFDSRYVLTFLLALLPVVLYFTYWLALVYRDASRANYTHTMWLNLISATCLNAFFIHLFLSSTNILEAL